MSTSHKSKSFRQIAAVLLACVIAISGIAIASSAPKQPAAAASYHSEIPDSGTASITSQIKANVQWVTDNLRHDSSCCNQAEHLRCTWAPTVTVNGKSYQGGCYETWIGYVRHGWYAGAANGTGSYTYIKTEGDWAYYCLDSSGFGRNQYCQNGVWEGTQKCVFRVPATGYLKVAKSSGNTTFTDGNSRYSLAGAVYGVYRNSGCTDLATTLTTKANGQTDVAELVPGTYYVKEITASKGYRLDTTAHSVNVAGTTQSSPAVVNSTEQPQRGKIKVSKKSTGIWSIDYDTYSLAGATYEVRDQKGKLWATLVTDIYGNATSPDLPLNLYTVKETVAPKGYCLNITPFNVDIIEDNVTKTGDTTDKPGTGGGDPFGTKKDFNHNADNTGYDPQGEAELSNAVYQLSYYDGYYETLAQVNALTPKRVTTMTTEMLNGKAIINAKANTADVSKSNLLYDGYSWGLPLGTYKLKEITPPKGYEKDPQEYLVWCQPDSAANGHLYAKANSITETNKAAEISASNRLVLTDMVSRGDFSLMKYIEVTTDIDQYPDRKKPAAGVQFEIINDNDYDVLNVETGKWIKKGQVVYTLTTDDQGYASTYRQQTENGMTGILNNNNQTGQAPGALAYGSYIVREVPETTPEGYKPIENYHFSISANHYQHHQIFENKTGTVVRVNKTDEGTQLNVRGVAKFRILDSNKEIITFDEPYPSSGKYSTLSTDISGSVILPEKLLMGTYYIQEVEAPEGYLYTDALIPFEVNSSTVNTYDTPMDVSFPDAPAKGQIALTKIDSETGLPIVDASATYDVFAAEDIVTEDGTCRAKKDEKVSTIKTGTDGKGKSGELFLGKYYVKETVAPDGYLIDNARHDVELTYAGDRVTVTEAFLTLDDVAVNGQIQAVKVDSDSKNAIEYEGAVFEIRAAENVVGKDRHTWYTKGELVDTIKTNADGVATSAKKLPLGKYEVVETQAPYGYVTDSTPVPVELKYADQNTAVVSTNTTKEDRASTGDFDIAKLDRETGLTVFTPGCEIDIYADEEIRTLDGSVHYMKDAHVGSVKTDETGKVTSKLNLPVGKYRLSERTAPHGYVLDNERQYQVEITWDGGLNGHNIYEASISDMPAKGVITFTKADAETGKTIPMAGIKAQVIAAEDIYTGDNTLRTKAGTVVAELTTDENGFAQTGELYLGKYQVKEIFAPEGYLLNETPVDVEIVYGGQDVPVVMQASQIADENAKGVIEIIKIDKETGKVVQLPDTTFEVRAKTDIVTGDGTVRASAGELVDTVATDATGKGSTKELYLGIYTITETVAPHGYTLDTTPHDAVIAYKDQHTPIVLTTESIANTVQKGVISVTKVDTESGLTVLKSGAVFEVKAVEDIVTPDGTKRVSAGEVVDTIETDDSGVASTKALYLGKYEVRETQAPEGYLLTDEVKSVELVYGAQTEPLVYKMESVADQVVKGTITIHKEDSDLDEPLPNVEYEIRAAEDIVTGDGIVHHKKGDVIETVVTDKSGTATSNELYLGEYVVVETKQPNGYELDTKEYPVHLRYANQVTPLAHEDIILYNTPSSISVKKVSTADAELVVPDTKFVGWSVADELTDAGMFAVFADDSAKIESASIDYMGELKTTGAYVTERSFELGQHDNEGGYQMFSSGEELEQGDYILHVKYVKDGKTVENDIPFVVNEYDKNAFFAIGDIMMSGDNANKFEYVAITSDNTDNDGTDGDDNATNEPNDTTNENMNDEHAMVLADDENAGADIDEDTSDKVETGDVEGGAGNTEQEAGDVDESKPSVPADNSDVKRVPAVLMSGKFSYAVTDENGIATFKYVPQGKVAFAEYEPAEGYVSDRTPGYVNMTDDGAAGDIEVTGNISKSDEKNADGNFVFDMTFADDQTKLHISKKDITTSDELPGNTLSVYEYEGDGSSDIVENDDYGKLIETWVSTDEPHYMELLPQGTYILKEEQAVDGYTIAESIIFRLNDTGVEQRVLMNNEHEAAVADEFIEMVETADFFPMALASAIVIMISAAGIIWYRRQQQKA